jgi:hypothetical protein
MRATQKTALILIVVSVGALLLHFHYKKDHVLRYEGRSIHYWFTQLPATIVSSQHVIKAESMTVHGKQYGSADHVSKAYAALDHFSPHAIDYLMDKLVERDSILEQKATEVALKLGATSFPARNSWVERGQAVTGLIYLKELPPETVQALTQLSRSSRPEVAEAAKFILRTDKRDPDIICKGFVISGNVRIP